ncbi:MAG: YdcF family protein [Elusimicrobia bacterium]|nr:YdcF family protein [Elusimicrobiota bacterium]
MAAVGWWLDCSDPPERADAIVVLGGGFFRPMYGADLYREGLAPQVWISRILPEEHEAPLRELGVPLRSETALNRIILLKKGVPAKDIRLYGQDVNSTRDEAASFAREFGGGRGRTILLVTSRYHARRARLIFRGRLPGSRVIVCPTPYETFDRRWWRHKGLTFAAATETLKLLNYLTGSFFGRGA